MEVPIGEFLDRFSIITLKHHHMPDEVQTEFDVYWHEYTKLCEEHPEWDLPRWLLALVDINNTIWGWESDLRKGQLKEYDIGSLSELPQEELLQLAAVGQAAVHIRDDNKKRKAVVNCLVKITGTGFPEVKINHASEESINAGAC